MMAEFFQNDDKQKMTKKGDNSDKDLIQFSDNEDSHCEKDIIKSDEQKSKHGFRTNCNQQSSNETLSARPKLQAHSDQAIYPPTIAATSHGISDRTSKSMNKKTQSSRNRADQPFLTRSLACHNPHTVKRVKNAHVTGHRQPATAMTTSGLQVQTRSQSKQVGTNRGILPKNPEYISIDARISSFELWPEQIRQTREEMADAGLYYTGKDDLVKCFQCGGNLRGWKASDDVWTEHARLFPLCSHVKTWKGKDFISQVQAIIDKDDDLLDRRKSMKYFKEVEDLRMRFSKLEFLCAFRHLKNSGVPDPTLNETVEALCQQHN